MSEQLIALATRLAQLYVGSPPNTPVDSSSHDEHPTLVSLTSPPMYGIHQLASWNPLSILTAQVPTNQKYEHLLKELEGKKELTSAETEVENLGEWGDERAYKYLALALAETSISGTAVVKEAFEKMSKRGVPISDQSIDAIIAHLGTGYHPDDNARYALKSLGKRAVERLGKQIELTQASGDSGDKSTAFIRALEFIEDPESARYLTPLLKHDYPYVRVLAVRAMAKLNPKYAVDILISALHDTTKFTSDCSIAIDLLFECPEYLVDCALNVRVADYAADTLIKIGDPRAAGALREYASKNNLDNSIEIQLYESCIRKARDKNRLTDAIVYYRKLLELAPTKVEYVLEAARVCKELGRIDEAMLFCKKAITICKDCNGSEAERLLAELEQLKMSRPSPAKSTFLFISDTKGLNSVLSSAVFQALRINGINAVEPNLSEMLDRKDVKACSAVSCTAEIAGAMGLDVGILFNISEVSPSLPPQFRLSLQLVNLDGNIIEKSELYVAKSNFRTVPQAQELGKRLALEMVKKLK